MTNLELQIKAFKDEHFHKADEYWHFRKLCEEVGELGEALMRGDDMDIMLESGDVGIVLAGLLLCRDKSLSVSMATAMDKNEARLHREKQK